VARVLLLEDEYFLLRLYTKALRAAGHETDGAMNLEAAFELFDQHSYSLFVSDIRIGRLDGETLIQRLGQIYDPAQCEILVISAHMDRYQDVCRSVGLQHFLPKPFSNAALVEAVENILRGS
jgi:DNA-binding response OmpR family regulator